MIPVLAGVRVWLATGHTDTRQGFGRPAIMVQEKVKTQRLKITQFEARLVRPKWMQFGQSSEKLSRVRRRSMSQPAPA